MEDYSSSLTIHNELDDELIRRGNSAPTGAWSIVPSSNIAAGGQSNKMKISGNDNDRKFESNQNNLSLLRYPTQALPLDKMAWLSTRLESTAWQQKCGYRHHRPLSLKRSPIEFECPRSCRSCSGSYWCGPKPFNQWIFLETSCWW